MISIFDTMPLIKQNVLGKIGGLVNLCVNNTIEKSIEIREPTHLLLSNMNEIRKVEGLYHTGFAKFLYFNKEKVKEILYNSEEFIEVKRSNKEDKLSDYFYLSLLINNNPNFVDYIYNLDYIKSLDDYNKINESFLKKIVISKIITDLIYNYKCFDIQEKAIQEKELNRIEEENMAFIANNAIKLKEFGINMNTNNVRIKKIDQIYSEIIIHLIKNNKFEEYDYIYKIIKELDFESLSITSPMFKELRKALDHNSDFINQYKIEKCEDLNNIKKVNFYYILLKYILKYSFFIYHIPFLYEAKKTVINIVKNETNELLLILESANDDMKIKIEYLLKIIPDTEYFYIKYLKFSKMRPLKEILIYYKNYYFETKKEDIKKLKNILEKNIKGNYENYLKDLEIAKKLNERYPVIQYLYREENKSRKENELEEEEITTYANNWMNIEKTIKDKKSKLLRRNKKISLIKFFTDKNNEKLLLKIFKKDEYDHFIQENIKFLNKTESIDYTNDKNENKEEKDNSKTNSIIPNTKTNTKSKQKKSSIFSSKLKN